MSSTQSRRVFDAGDYPHGCRCACCMTLFEDCDLIVDRDVAPDWSTPTCETCAAAGAPLEPGHPFGGAGVPVARPDGLMTVLRASP